MCEGRPRGRAGARSSVSLQQWRDVTGYTSEMWNTAVRAGPVVLGIVLFASVNGLRHWFKVHYTPSYFVLFPISLLDKDIAQLTGLGPFSPVENEAQRRKRKHQFLAKAVISAVLTFAVIPLAHGVTAALYARPTEFMLSLLRFWSGKRTRPTSQQPTM